MKSFCNLISEVISEVLGNSIDYIGDLISLMDLADYATIAGVVIGGAIFWYIAKIPIEPLLIPPELNGIIVMISGVLCFLPLILI